jgi:hypothetical protein
VKSAGTQVVWAEEAVAKDVRTLPPRHAENAAMAMYQKVARRNPAQKRSKIGWPSLIFAGVFFVLAAVIFPFDKPLLHLGTGGLAFAGLACAIKGLLGH